MASIDYARINAAALAACPGLLERWMPDGRLSGGQWTARNPTRHDRRPGSFKINVRTGQWIDHATGDAGGDLVALVAYLRGIGQGEAARELAGELGLPGGQATYSGRWPEQPTRPAEDVRLADRIRLARTIWRDAKPDRHHDLVAEYLAGRGITLDSMPSIRSGDVWHPFERRDLPAMVCAIQQADGSVRGVHQTYLDLATAAKAQIEKPKLMCGLAAAGVVRLACAGPRMALAEGVETGLSIQRACPELAVWCALSAGNMAKLVLPPEVRELTIFADGDAAGECAAREAAETYHRAHGVDVRVAVAPPGLDFNDVLLAKSEAEDTA